MPFTAVSLPARCSSWLILLSGPGAPTLSRAGTSAGPMEQGHSPDFVALTGSSRAAASSRAARHPFSLLLSVSGWGCGASCARRRSTGLSGCTQGVTQAAGHLAGQHRLTGALKWDSWGEKRGGGGKRMALGTGLMPK